MRMRTRRIGARAAGILLLAALSAAGFTVQYTYDDAGRLLRADYGGGQAIDYAYDANGNLLMRSASDGGAHLVIYAAAAGGSIVGAATQTVAHGANGEAVFALTNLYQGFAGWSDARADNPRTETNVMANVSVVAWFSPLLAPRGTPHAWLAGYGLATGGVTFAEAEEGDTDGDADPAWREYGADTDPTNALSFLRIVGLEGGPPRTVLFDPGSTGRVYTLQFSADLAEGSWSNVPGQGPRPGAAGPDAMVDTNAAPVRFHRVRVAHPP